MIDNYYIYSPKLVINTFQIVLLIITSINNLEERLMHLNQTCRTQKKPQHIESPRRKTRQNQTAKGGVRIQNWPCYVCSQQKKNRFFQFAQCSHKLVCNECCQNQLKTCIQQMKKPKCFVQNCNAGLNTGENSAYQHFSSSIKDKWEINKIVLNQNPSEDRNVIRRCSQLNCTGFLLKQKNPANVLENRAITYECHVCNKKYCQNCLKPFHGLESCKKQKIELPDSMKQCPKCDVVIYKFAGCNKVTCSSCTYTFCFNCGSQWSQQHQNCQGTILQQIKNFFWGVCQRLSCKNSNTVI